MTAAIETMAYVGDEPWHGLGVQLPPGSSIEEWQTRAGLDWEVYDSPVLFKRRNPFSGRQELAPLDLVPTEQTLFEGKKVLYRSDTGKPLSVVSDRYQVVHPRRVLEFYRDLVADHGYQIETAGSLKGGARVWALAKTGAADLIGPNDQIRSYLLLATSYDTTLSTTTTFTSVRVVCNNTLELAAGDDKRVDIRLRHDQQVDFDELKGRLGIEGYWSTFVEQAREMSRRTVSRAEATDYFLKVIYGDKAESIDLDDVNSRQIKRILEAYAHAPGTQETAWGALNAVTYYVDHIRGRTDDSRIDSAWFGPGRGIKNRAHELALQLAA